MAARSEDAVRFYETIQVITYKLFAPIYASLEWSRQQPE